MLVVYHIYSKSSHNLVQVLLFLLLVVYHIYSKSSHNCCLARYILPPVVYHIYSKSSHNPAGVVELDAQLYIISILNQATTYGFVSKTDE